MYCQERADTLVCPSSYRPYAPRHTTPYAPWHTNPYAPRHTDPFAPRHTNPYAPRHTTPYAPRHTARMRLRIHRKPVGARHAVPLPLPGNALQNGADDGGLYRSSGWPSRRDVANIAQCFNAGCGVAVFRPGVETPVYYRAVPPGRWCESAARRDTACRVPTPSPQPPPEWRG